MTSLRRSALAAAVAIGALFSLSACNEQVAPIHTRQTDNPAVAAKLLATVDGCRLWSVWVGTRTVYLARCPENGAAETVWTENCGKGCTRSVEVVPSYQGGRP